ncbi:hypothetical protein RHSIM_Rhsim07G0091000 [Rhododendron simsii]|uniref:Uncharacterized protein n=1 Tax=Rhododendron simsii TaxID=118357 RepID=A0A834GNK3_RHOSS|nr:hypothetical protein RHSIM_Rhsim07G0091000 [Rhododendron simsii]
MESIAATSILGYPPVWGRYCPKDVSSKRNPSNFCRFPVTKFLGRKLVCSAPLSGLGVDRLAVPSIKAKAVELTKEAYCFLEERIDRGFEKRVDTGLDRKLGLWPRENKADKPSLENPLLRRERMGCGWFGAIFEWEGVLIEDNPNLENQAWLTLSEEVRKPPPLGFILSRIQGMKNEHAISEVLCWSRGPTQVRRMALRKEQIYQALRGGKYGFRFGSKEFVKFLMDYKIPMALVSTRPRKTLEKAVRAMGMEGVFSVIVAAEDVYRGKPDPEMFVYAGQLLNCIPERCIVFGNSNLTVEAAHDARMKCVAVASKNLVYELGAADMVVTHLNELSLVDLKNLADIESAEFGSGEFELEMEMEEENEPYRSSYAAVNDDFW